MKWMVYDRYIVRGKILDVRCDRDGVTGVV